MSSRVSNFDIPSLEVNRYRFNLYRHTVNRLQDSHTFYEPFGSILREVGLSGVDVLLRYVCLVMNNTSFTTDAIATFPPTRGDFLTKLKAVCEVLRSIDDGAKVKQPEKEA
jgi:hypothetical protein